MAIGERTLQALLSVSTVVPLPFLFVQVMKGLESCDVSVASDVPSSLMVMVDGEPHMNAGSSVGTQLFSTRTMLSISAGSGVVDGDVPSAGLQAGHHG